MKRFDVDKTTVIFVDLTKINGVRAWDGTVNIFVDGGAPLIFDGGNKEDAIKFAENLAKEIEAAKKAKLEELISKNNAEIEECVRNICKDFGIVDTASEEESQLPYEDGILRGQYGEKVEVDDIKALYVGGEDYNEVRVLYKYDILIKRFDGDNGEKAGACIGKLARYTDLTEVAPNGLYVDPYKVTCVTVDDGKNNDYEVNVVISNRKFLAANSGGLQDAFKCKRAIEELLDNDK